MAKGYALFQYNVVDSERIKQYIPIAVSTIAAHGGKILVATDDADQREGTARTKRTVILEFPSQAAAVAWYESPDYQASAHLRHESSADSSGVILPGFAMPGA